MLARWLLWTGVVVAALSPGCSQQADDPAPGVCDAARPEVDWRLTADGPALRDALGRRVLLRGINAGGRSKLAPYAPFDFDEGHYDEALAAYLDRAASWGVDALRVPFAWAAVEPAPGQRDEAFLGRYDRLLDAAWARGMWTIVDFHQDIYAEALCGDGFPDWTLPEPRPAPKRDCKTWFLAYNSSDDVKAAFDRFWGNQGDTRPAFRALWRDMALRHRDRPGVAGFEIMNEPSQGSADKATWERETLSPFLAEMATQLRADAPRSLVFFDVPGDAFLGSLPEVTPPPGGGTVFAPHWYEPLAFLGLAPDLAGVEPSLQRWKDLSNTWAVPMLLGESGVRRDKDFTGPLARSLFDAVDKLGVHFTYWEYSASAQTWNFEDFGIVDTQGNENAAVLDQLARPFPRAVAGGEPTFSFDPETRSFHLSYDATADGVTEVSIPARTYPRGVDAQVTGGCARQEGGLLLIKAAAAARVEVTLTPKP
jgi:endoglycosylceramidase